MSRKTFRLCGLVVTMAIGATIGWSISIGNALIPVVAVAAGMSLMYLLGKRVKQVLRDERTCYISEKASRFTLGVSLPVIAVASAVLLALSSSDSADLRLIGFTLAYSACAIMVIYYGFYLYYASKS